jgi:hypothetical protein
MITGYDIDRMVEDSKKSLTVFHGFDWTPADVWAAQQEGWDIFEVDFTGVLEIQALDDSTRFSGRTADTQAREYVNSRARSGSAFHMKALLILARTIVEEQLHSYGDDTASDIETAQAEMNKNGTDCNTWGANLVSQLTILRSVM